MRLILFPPKPPNQTKKKTQKKEKSSACKKFVLTDPHVTSEETGLWRNQRYVCEKAVFRGNGNNMGGVWVARPGINKLFPPPDLLTLFPRTASLSFFFPAAGATVYESNSQKLSAEGANISVIHFIW